MPTQTEAVHKAFKSIFISLLLACPAESYPGPPINLDNLIAEASLITIGEITSVKEVGKTTVALEDRDVSAEEMVAELRVDQVLKGATGNISSLQVHYDVTDEFVGRRSVAPLSYRMFFLVQSSEGLKLASPYYPSAVAVRGTKIEEGTASERVMSELGAVLKSETTPLPERQEAVFVLSTSRSPAAVEALRQGANTNDVSLRLAVSAALLKNNDISTLQFAEDALLKPSPSYSPELLHNLSSAIYWVKDEHAVPALTRLLRTGSNETRRSAAAALMRIGSRLSIDAFLSAVNDSDFQVRYYSVVALAEITGQMDWRPNTDDFNSDQNKYLDHWREWSKSRN